MANQVVVCVYDVQLGAFLRPFCAPSTGVAIRSFVDALQDPQSEMAKHPNDYELHQLAVFDDHEGEFTPVKKADRLLLRGLITKSEG